MNTVVVRCTGCRELSRVTAEAVGLEVACPRCGATFVAQPEGTAADPPVVRRAESARIPVVRPRPKPATPVRWELAEPTAPPDVERIPPTGGLIALALLPFGIPLLWLLASALTQREVIMSFAVPLAVAVGVSGLGFGTVYVTRWSIAARVKAMAALLLLGYFAAGFLFIVQKEWLQDLRRVFNRGDLGWRNFSVKPEKGLIGYQIQCPAGWQEEEADSPFPNAQAKAVQFSDPKRQSTEVFQTAVGKLSNVPAFAADRVWFDAATKLAQDAAPDAVLDAERAVTLHDRVTNEKVVGGEFHFTKAGGDWSRVVRVYRVRGYAVYLAVEGSFLTPDAADVVHFLESLKGPFTEAKAPAGGQPK